jgi:hypothetical protein
LLRIVHHLCRQQGGTVRGRIQTESFRAAVNALTSDKDVVTRLSLACCNPTGADKLSGVRMTLGKAFAALQRRVSAHGP